VLNWVRVHNRKEVGILRSGEDNGGGGGVGAEGRGTWPEKVMKGGGDALSLFGAWVQRCKKP